MRPNPGLDLCVAQYISTDIALRSILIQQRSPSPLHAAMILLCDFLNGKQSANGAFLAARQIDIRGANAELCILFLTVWSRACLVQSDHIPERKDTAQGLLHRARALVSDATPPEITALLALEEASLAGSAGNTQKQESLIRGALQDLSLDSPRRKFALLELALLLAQLGRLVEIQKELRQLPPPSPQFEPVWITSIQFLDHVECGRIEDAMASVDTLAATEATGYAIDAFRATRTLLELMQAPAAEAVPDPDVAENRTDLPDWALVLHCLLAGSIHQALRWARWCEKRRPCALTGKGFAAFNLVRAELAEGNVQAADRIMAMRKDHGNHHYLDDFFLARIAWLSHKQDAAATHFSSLLKAVDQHRASGRLDFELRLASEIPRDVLLNLTRTSETMRLSDRTRPAPSPSSPPEDLPEGLQRIVGSGSAIREIRATIQRFAGLDVPVLVTGETGTGKELVAKALHEAGPRNGKPFVAINCGAISDSLLESELFGHEKGAFSGAASAHQGLFEEAAAGTIFLDEIGEISPRLQVVLLRVLETGEIRPVGSSRSRAIHCRIVASTNADLESLAAQDKFRRDMLFRLRRLEIHLSPLRQRPEDILTLAQYFLDLHRAEDEHALLSEGLQDALRAYPWPGNVRELRNTIERMRLVNSDKLYYDKEDLDLPGVPAPTLRAAASPPPAAGKAIAPLKAIPLTPQAQQRPRFHAGRSRVRRIENLRELFLAHRILTRQEVIRTLEISPNTATADLKSLCDEGFIEKIQPTASPRSAYFSLKKTGDTATE